MMMALMQTNHGKPLSELLAGVATVDAAMDRVISGVSLDSRQAKAGDLFLACAGHQVHGVYFAEQAVNQGAVAVVVEDSDGVALAIADLRRKTQVPVIAVADLGKRAGIIAERFFDHPSKQLLTIGVTGTNGKTSCSQFLAQALSEDKPCGIVGTIGNGLYGRLENASHTTPDAVSLHGLFKRFLDEGAASVVMEVSSHGLTQGRVAGVAFDVAVFTNLSRDHLDYHGDMESYSNAKKRLFFMPGVKHAVINVDDEFGRQLSKALPAGLEIITYGIGEQSDITVKASHLRLSPQGLSFDVITPWGNGTVRSSLLGRFNVSNLLAVLATLLVVGVPMDKAIQRLQRFGTVAGRMERVPSPDSTPLIVVDYAHTPDAVEKALKSLDEHFQNTGNGSHRLFCVFGCGGDRDKGKRAVMGAMAQANADQIVITNDNPRSEEPGEIVKDIMQGITQPHKTQIILDREQAIRWALQHADKNDAVIILGKGHEQYQIFGKDKRPYAGDNEVARRIAVELNAEVKS